MKGSVFLGFCTVLVSALALCSCFCPLGSVTAWVFAGDEAYLWVFGNQRQIRGSCASAPAWDYFVTCGVVPDFLILRLLAFVGV